MNSSFVKWLLTLFPILALGFSISSQAAAKTINVKCDVGQTVQRAVNQAQPGDTINVSGTCMESVEIIGKRRLYITSNAGTGANNGAGAIIGDPDKAAIKIVGGGVIISNLTITSTGSGTGEEAGAVVIVASSAVSIEDCIIIATEYGIAVSASSLGDIKRSNITSANRSGVLISQSSSAFFNDNDIHHNAEYGVLIVMSSSASFDNNDIHDNGANGVLIAHSSSASFSGNTINDNALDGLFVAHVSSVQLDNFSPVTTTLNNFDDNGGYGVSCAANSSIGTSFVEQVFSGNTSGATLIDGSCTVVNTVPGGDSNF